ncbi:MAG: type II secretion system protein [bacterium]
MLELLIVMGIIGILSSIVLLRGTDFRNTAKDMANDANVKNLKRLLEQYNGKHLTYPIHTSDIPIITLVTSNGDLSEIVMYHEVRLYGGNEGTHLFVNPWTGAQFTTNLLDQGQILYKSTTNGHGYTITQNSRIVDGTARIRRVYPNQ